MLLLKNETYYEVMRETMFQPKNAKKKGPINVLKTANYILYRLRKRKKRRLMIDSKNWFK